MGNREELLKIFQSNKELAARNPDIAAEVLSGKTPESLLPARLPQNSAIAGDSSPAAPDSHKDRPGTEKPATASQGLNGGAKKRKYGNEPVEFDNIKFDSLKEAKRYSELRLLERAGKIENLQVHPKYEFYHNGVRIGSFKPDFTYVEKGQVVVEDVKSPSTKKETSYRLRKNMLRAFYGLEVVEV